MCYCRNFVCRLEDAHKTKGKEKQCSDFLAFKISMPNLVTSPDRVGITFTHGPRMVCASVGLIISRLQFSKCANIIFDDGAS